MSDQIVEDMSPVQFVEMATQNKIHLIDILAARVLELGEEYALVNADYYRAKLAGQKDETFGALTYRQHRLEIEYDALKHAISALQSTLKAEQFPRG